MPRPTAPTAAPTPAPAPIAHYENFPVASWLCPPRLRAPIAAIYHFARTADDLADEGSASAQQRLHDLAAYRQALTDALATPHAPQPHSPDANTPPRWPHVFGPLAHQAHIHQLPAQPLHHLLDAFEQDVRYTDAGARYPDTAALLDYCRRSANPVGRLLLHLYGVNDKISLAQSDAICSALQLINFWQDLGQDLRRQRHYLPQDALQRHGVDEAALMHSARTGQPLPADADTRAQALLAELCQQARQLMQHGAPLAVRLPGRIGWELRLVVQGGLRILDQIAALQHSTWLHRPRLRAHDAPRLLWHAWRM